MNCKPMYLFCYLMVLSFAARFYNTSWVTGSYFAEFVPYTAYVWDKQWPSCMRHCATNRKVAGLIPDGVIGGFHCYNLSGRTMVFGSTQPLTEISTRNISWG
jgi:hypothetical protein